ncbi:MAG: hypothetical protein P8Z80_04345 [Pseudolabrys sp.]
MDDATKFSPNLARYEAPMDVVRNRLTTPGVIVVVVEMRQA